MIYYGFNALWEAIMISITPYLESSDLGEYQDKIVDLIRADAELNRSIPNSIRGSLEWLLRLVNSYYSNRIEGNPTHPKDLLSTQSKQGKDKAEQTKDIMELLAHLEVQMRLEKMSIDAGSVVSCHFIQSIHEGFYQGLPDEALLVKNHDGTLACLDNGEYVKVIPGAYRELPVIVGKHIPPEPSELSGYMRWVEDIYNPTRIHGTGRICAAAALHHRLAWIHPFMDGNGRTIRLVTDAYMKNIAFEGYGLWSLARGFGRDSQKYYKALAQADMPRQGNSDGRGILSKRGLVDFTRYFIDTALDQVQFFNHLLDPSSLRERIDVYFEFRARGALVDLYGKKTTLKIEARDIYKLLLDRGPMFRSEISQHFGKSEQTLRPIINQMRDEELVKAEPKHKVEPRLSPHIVETIFPGLW